MEETGFDMWIVLCREYNEDPVFPTMIPSLCLTARRLSCLVFVNNESGFSAYNFGRPDERLSTVYTQGYDNTQPGRSAAAAGRLCPQNKSQEDRHQLFAHQRDVRRPFQNAARPAGSGAG